MARAAKQPHSAISCRPESEPIRRARLWSPCASKLPQYLLTACGYPVGLMAPGDGQSQREGLRRYQNFVARCIARDICSEISAKLHVMRTVDIVLAIIPGRGIEGEGFLVNSSPAEWILKKRSIA